MKAVILTLALLTSATLAAVAETKDSSPFAAVLTGMQARGLEVKDMVYAANLLYFTATDAEHGLELWKTDGTPAGTVLVRDIRPGIASAEITNLVFQDGAVFFMANDGKSGPEPWISDGTADGTFPIHDPFRYKMANARTASVSY